MNLAETPQARAAADAGVRWGDIERRADDLARTLYGLREDAPNDEDRARIDDTLASLHAVRSAMSAERAPGADGELQAQIAQDRLRSFGASIRPPRQDRYS
jgi:predicted ATPase